MKSRKFPTFEDAKAYMEKAGEVKFFGRAGERYTQCIYTLTVGSRVYHISLHDDGLLEVVDETFRRD